MEIVSPPYFFALIVFIVEAQKEAARLAEIEAAKVLLNFSAFVSFCWLFFFALLC